MTTGETVSDQRVIPYFQVHNEIIDEWSLSVAELALYITFIRYTNNLLGYAFPSRKKLAIKFGVGERTIDKYIQNLVDSGLIKVERKKGQNNHYTVLDLVKTELGTKSDTTQCTKSTLPSVENVHPIKTKDKEQVKRDTTPDGKSKENTSSNHQTDSKEKKENGRTKPSSNESKQDDVIAVSSDPSKKVNHNKINLEYEIARLIAAAYFKVNNPMHAQIMAFKSDKKSGLLLRSFKDVDILAELKTMYQLDAEKNKGKEDWSAPTTIHTINLRLLTQTGETNTATPQPTKGYVSLSKEMK